MEYAVAPESHPTPPNSSQTDLEKLKALLPQKASLVTGNSKDWKLSRRRIGRDDWIEVFFVDADIGWIAAIKGDTIVPSGGSLFKTADGGQSWIRLPLKLPASSFISLVRFVDRSRGWLIVQTINREATKIQVMETSDGGVTWTPGFSLAKAIVAKMLFDKNGEGWVIGIRAEAVYIPSQTNFVLHTRDFGKSWQDVTPKSATRDDTGTSPVPFEDIFTDILLEDGSNLTAISRDGSISTTTDGGSTWKVLTKLDIREQHSRGFSRLMRLANNDFVAVSGSDGHHGVWSTFTRYEEGKERNSTSLGKIFVTDMGLDSSCGVIAAGLKSNFDDESKAPTSALILSTRDFEEWELLFEVSSGCKFGCKFNKMSRRGDGYCLVGSDGLIMTMDRRL